MNIKNIILTGDRPTGKLHVGHYIGSLANRVKLQDSCNQFIIIADLQALTDNFNDPDKVRLNILELMCDYLAVGIDPIKSTIFIQSMIPALPELTMYFMNLVTLARLQRNPTVKLEIQQKNFDNNIPVGFLVYPISQAADIAAFKANLVPVGEDQLPMIEQLNEIVRSFNRIYSTNILVEAKPLISKISRVPGIDGKAKMGKSLGNAIYLSDSADELTRKVKMMYTDPFHTKIDDPGKIDGNMVFAYLDLFARDQEKVDKFKHHYQRGGLGDSIVKKYLLDELEIFIAPIRERRLEYEKDKANLMNMLLESTEHAAKVAEQTLQEVKQVLKLKY